MMLVPAGVKVHIALGITDSLSRTSESLSSLEDSPLESAARWSESRIRGKQ